MPDCLLKEHIHFLFIKIKSFKIGATEFYHHLYSIIFRQVCILPEPMIALESDDPIALHLLICCDHIAYHT